MEKTTTAESPKKRSTYGQGSVMQRGGGWQISFYDNNGRRRRETYSTEKQATKKLTAMLALRDEGKLDELDSRVLVDTLASLYVTRCRGEAPKSVDWIELVWRVHLEPAFRGFIASRITTEKLLAYRAERLEANAAPSTVNRELAILRAIFYHGLEGFTPPKINRVPKFPSQLEEASPRQGFLTDEQYDALQANCPHEWMRGMMAVAYYFGLRKGELLNMRVQQVDLKEKIISLWTGETKSGKGRKIALTDEVHSLLAPCVAGKKPQDFVFTWANGRQVLDFRSSWDKMCTAAKVPVLLHDFRRSAVRNMVRSGISREVCKKISGHSTDAIFSRYDITTENDLVDAAQKIENRRRQMVTN